MYYAFTFVYVFKLLYVLFYGDKRFVCSQSIIAKANLVSHTIDFDKPIWLNCRRSGL